MASASRAGCGEGCNAAVMCCVQQLYHGVGWMSTRSAGTVPYWGQWTSMSLGQCPPADFVTSLAGGYGKPLCPVYLLVSVNSFQYLVGRVALPALARLATGYKIEDVDWVSRNRTIIHKPNGILDHSCEPECLFWPTSAHYLSPVRNAHECESFSARAWGWSGTGGRTKDYGRMTKDEGQTTSFPWTRVGDGRWRTG
jgi:hypothetical protein